MNVKDKSTQKPQEPSPVMRAPRQADYLLRESDLERIDCLIGSLGLAITQILSCRELRDRSCEEMPALEDFDSQIALVLDEAARQMELPWRYSSDF